MTELKEWLENFVDIMQKLFGSRLEFIGLQGSYGRGEATEDSDIDMVVILGEVTMQDLKAYDKAISGMEHREKICGFISGKKELANWEKSDLFQFYHDTTPILGKLELLLPAIGGEDVKRAIRIGACNIYHMCGHNIVHEKDAEILKGLYKSATFVLQAKYFAATGNYVKKKSELQETLAEREQIILRNAERIKQESEVGTEEFEALSETLFVWAGQMIEEYGHSITS